MTAFSQEKVTDKSSKTPHWINATAPDFIIKSGSGPTIDDARDNALLRVKENIISSVAESIISSTEQKSSEENTNDKSQINGSFKTYIRTQTADIPYLKGVSINKVSEFYWEKLEDKKKKSIHYQYYLKYPFSSLELHSLILDFELNQRRMMEQIDELGSSIDTVVTIEQLYATLQALRNFLPVIDGQNKSRAESYISKLELIISSVTLTEISHTEGKLTFMLAYGNQKFRTALKPKIKSNCANNFRVSSSESSITILYDQGGCFSGLSNSVTVEYNGIYPQIKGDFSIPKHLEVTMRIIDRILVKSVESDSLSIMSWVLFIPIDSQFPDEITVDRVTIEIVGMPAMTFSPVENTMIQKGLNQLEIAGKQTVNRKQINLGNSSTLMASGNIVYTIPKSGKTGTYKFYNQVVSVNQ